MKKSILFAGVVLSSALLLTACSDSSSTDTSSKDKTSKTATSKKAPEFKKVGDTGEINGVKYTLKNVTTVQDRNEYSDTKPKNVIKVEYAIQNDSKEEISVGMDLEVYGPDNKKLESYPLDNSMDSLAAGKAYDAVQFFGTDNLGEFELQFSPIVDFSGKTLKFKATVNQ